MSRIRVYVDGFNFYHSLESQDIKEWGYVDFGLLATNCLRIDDDIQKVKYFSALDKPQEHKIARQTRRWWKALEFMGVEVIRGSYQRELRRCRCGKCECPRQVWKEKQTDVNLGFELGLDAGSFDHAVLLTGDSDFLGVVRRLRSTYPEKQVTMLLPPGQQGGYFRADKVPVHEVTVEDLEQSLLPRRIPDPSGSGDYAEAWEDWRCREDTGR